MPKQPPTKLKLAGVEFRLVCFTSTDRKDHPHVNIEPTLRHDKWLIVSFDRAEGRSRRRCWQRNAKWVLEADLRDRGWKGYQYEVTFEWAEVEAEVGRAIANLTGKPLKPASPPPKGKTAWARLAKGGPV